MSADRKTIARFFGLKDPATVDPVTAEAQVQMARGTVRLIIHDFIGRIQRAWKAGPTLPVITADNDVHWSDVPSLRLVRQRATSAGDDAMAEAIDSAIRVIEDLDPCKNVAFARLTPDQFRIYLLSTDEPERQLDDILASWTC